VDEGLAEGEPLVADGLEPSDGTYVESPPCGVREGARPGAADTLPDEGGWRTIAERAGPVVAEFAVPGATASRRKNAPIDSAAAMRTSATNGRLISRRNIRVSRPPRTGVGSLAAVAGARSARSQNDQNRSCSPL